MTYDVSRPAIPERPIFSIRHRMTPSELPGFIGHSFAELFSHLRLLGVAVSGEPFVIYHAHSGWMTSTPRSAYRPRATSSRVAGSAAHAARRDRGRGAPRRAV